MHPVLVRKPLPEPAVGTTFGLEQREPIVEKGTLACCNLTLQCAHDRNRGWRMPAAEAPVLVRQHLLIGLPFRDVERLADGVGRWLGGGGRTI